MDVEEYKQEKFIRPVKRYWARIKEEMTPEELSEMMRQRRLGKKNARHQD